MNLFYLDQFVILNGLTPNCFFALVSKGTVCYPSNVKLINFGDKKMIEKYRLSLWSAIFINVNIMLGAGIFINTAVLAQRAGSLGFVSYLLVGIMMLPLILATTKLLSKFPDCGFYGFGKGAGAPFVGFVSAWSYFIGKLASGALVIYIATKLLQSSIPAISVISTPLLASVVILIFMMLNMLQMKTGRRINIAFMVLKI